MIRIEELDEQTRLILEPLEFTEAVSVGFWFLSGSRDEERQHYGYTHFLEHMLFKGTERRSALQIAREFDRVGGAVNAFTDKENCCYHCTVPREALPLALDVLGDMVFHSVLDSREIEKEKSVILNEIMAALDTPEELAHDLFLQSLWPEHPLGRKVTGEVADVMNLTREALFDFYTEKYKHAGLIISISGKFDPTEATALIRLLLEKIQRKPQLPVRTPPQPSYRTQYVKNRFTQVQIYAGTQLEGLPSLSDYYTLLVISTVLGESLSSRLFQKIREEQGLCYAISSFRAFYTDTALWMIYANTAREFVAPLLVALDRELASTRRELITAGELEEAKSHLKGNLILGREDTELRMKRLARLLLLAGQAIEFENSFGYIDEVSLEQVNTRLAQMLASERFHLLTFGNKKKINWKGFRFNF